MTHFYLDNNATTRVLPQVLDAMLPWFSECYGNPSSSHQAGQQAKSALIAARASVAKFLNASPAEIVFTSGATEANHTAILSALEANPHKRRIVTSAAEHSSTLLLLESLAKTRDLDLLKVGLKADGSLDINALKQAVTEDTALLSLMHANNETGVIFPITQAAAIAKAQGAVFHTDAAQSASKLALDVKQLNCDYLAFSGHKLHAPKGVGVLYVKKGMPVTPLLFGHQERNRRGGTENLPGIIGLGTACDLAQAHLQQAQPAMSLLRDQLQEQILARLPFAKINGHVERVPNTSNICFPGLHGEELLHRLNQANVYASQGSACTAGGTDPSHVLIAMGLSREDALSSVRFSLSRETTAVEIEIAVETIVGVVSAMTQTIQAAA